MSFSIDDPLADLLSDNSLDNDNFFDNPGGAAGLKKPNKVIKSKQKMEDLFGIEEESEVDVKTVDMSDFRSKPMAMSTPRIVKQKPSISHHDSDDDDLGFDPKKPKASSGVKKNLFDDLLSEVEKKQPATASASVSRKEEISKLPISRQSTETASDTSNIVLSQARPKTSSGRRSSAQSTFVNTDPMGLFSRDKESTVGLSGTSSPASKQRAATADWLGLGAESVGVSMVQEIPASPNSPKHSKDVKLSEANNSVEILRIPEINDNEILVELQEAQVKSDSTMVAPEQHLVGDSTAQNILQFNSLNLEANNAFTALKQQESQLVLVAHMKNQERTLLDMHRKQENLLKQQERQFETLLKQQLQRQQQMEEHIREQQQRINSHINLMISQPPLIQTSMPPPVQANDTGSELFQVHEDSTLVQRPVEKQEREEIALKMLEYETNVKRLELEKLRLEELVANMKVNYEQEIEMIENSFRKQLKVLEEHQSAMEDRLKIENKELKQYYSQKVESIEEDLHKLKHESEDEIASIKQDHEDVLRKLRKSHENDLDMLKEEYHHMLDTIRQSKMLEFAAVQSNGNYLDTLRMASNNLESLSGGLQCLRDDMQMKLETLNKEREKNLDARERRVEDAERRLKLEEESREQEKNRLMELVSTMELQLGRLSKESAEEHWQLRQRMVGLEAEKKAFELEKEFQREQFAKEEKRIDDLKAQQLAETERITIELQQERHRILVERTRIEMEQKLHLQTDLDKDRLEVEARLKVAHDSIQRADEERERYNKLLRELEQRKRKLIDQENALNAKEEELAQEISSYRIAESRSHISEQKSRQAEQMLQTKLQLLTKRMRELSEKEEYLSQERMLLAKDRITLHNLRLMLNKSKCTLCKMAAENVELAHIFRGNDIKQIVEGLGGGGMQMLDSSVLSSTVNFPQNTLVPQSDIVDRILDDNIAASFRRMHDTAPYLDADNWAIAGLDDDSKKLALVNNSNNREIAESTPQVMNPNLR